MDKPFKCDECDKSYPVVKHLKRHKISKHAVKCHHCEDCGRSFGAEVELRRHRRFFSKDSKACSLKCPCGKSFARRCALYLHKFTHKVEKPFKCSVCPVTFARHAEWATHEATHFKKKEFRYNCEFCPKGCYTLNALNNHRVIHTGEQPFRCDLCGKYYGTSINLAQHRKNHGKATTSHPCDLCGDAFRFVRVHRLTHQRPNQFSCEPCGLFFRFSRYLAFHMNKEHNPDNSEEIRDISTDQTFPQEPATDESRLEVPADLFSAPEHYGANDIIPDFVDVDQQSQDDLPGNSNVTSETNESDGDSSEFLSNRKEGAKGIVKEQDLEINLTDVSLEFQLIPTNEEEDGEEEDCFQINLTQAEVELQALG